MSRLNLVLLLLLMVSGLYLVRVAYDARRVFSELERERSRERSLVEARERLEVERRSAGASALVLRRARERLGMRDATAAVTTYLAHEPAGAASVGAPVDAGGRR